MRLKKYFKKIKFVLMIIALVGIMVGSQKLGEYLYAHTEQKNAEKETNAQVSESAVVVVDSGHGGSDPGKVGINGALEKDINLKISKKVETYLKAENIEVIMTREDENGLAESKVEDMKKRVAVINEKKPVLAVSIHQNSYGQESIHGAQVFYYSHSAEGRQAAEIMQKALLTADAENKRQAKENDTYYMLKRTEVPVIIVECGFLSNQEEAQKLVTEEYQGKIAKAVCEGVVTYIQGKH